MKKIADINYENVEFRFISNHYDVHLGGTCIYNGELCEFKNQYPELDEETDEWEEMIVEIYKLTLKEKIKWYWRQWLFEKCVGYHYSYSQRKRGERFRYRKPEWLYIRIFNLYYKLKKKKEKL
jgi:hypothetical protein